MGLGSVHRLCVVGSLGEKRLRSHRLLEMWGRIRGGGEGRGSLFLPDAMGQDQISMDLEIQGLGPCWDSVSVLLPDSGKFSIRLSFLL